MPLKRKSAVIGSAIFAPASGDDRALEELLYDVVQAALKDAGLKIDDIDGIVVAANDQFDGRAISIMAASGSVGGVDRDILSTPSAGEHAFVMSVLRVASGLYETHLVVAWSPTEASSLEEVERIGADPYFHRQLPLYENSSAALQASALLARHPGASELVRKITARNYASAARAYPDAKLPEPPATSAPWPLERGMPGVPVTGAVAMIIASEDYVASKGIANPAWVQGMGWATEAAFLGDRDLTDMSALREAARQAFSEAGLGAADQADVIELTGKTPYEELIVYEGLGLSAPDRWSADVASGRFEANGALPVNPSGGAMPINPVFCAGAIRIAEAANQVRGVCGAHQVEKTKTAIAHASSGFAMMYQTVLVLGASKQGVAA
jgi:acetyl-CoA C-acetyltransferase